MISHCKVCMKVGILTMKLFGKHYLFFYLSQCQEKNCFLIFICILCIAFMIWPDYAWTSMRYKLFLTYAWDWVSIVSNCTVGLFLGTDLDPVSHNVIRLNISATLTGNFLGQYLPYKILLLYPGKRVSNQSRKEWR